jgi:hypothetical protein
MAVAGRLGGTRDPVASDTNEQAAVCSRLRSMRMDTLCDICTIVIPNIKTPKESLAHQRNR